MRTKNISISFVTDVSRLKSARRFVDTMIRTYCLSANFRKSLSRLQFRKAHLEQKNI